MGDLYGVKCSKCEYRFQVDVGHGFDGCGFFEVNSDTGKPYYYRHIRSKRILDDVNRILETENDVREDDLAYEQRREWQGHGSAQYLCEQCGRLFNRYYFRLVFDGGSYVPEYSCYKCQQQLTPIELEHTKSGQMLISSDKSIEWKCPKCGHGELMEDPEAECILYD